MAAKFGTSGLRGLATELVGAPTQAHVASFARHLVAQGLAKRGAEICVAWDARASSPTILHDVVAAVGAEGLKARLYGAVPTPALALAAMSSGSAAIMITGSHIPADRNGIKFYTPRGEINKRDEAAIGAGLRAAALLAHGALPQIDYSAGHDFVRRYAKAFAGTLKGLRVGVYQHSTVARDLLIEVLQAAGAEAVGLGRSETFIPVDTEAVSDETQRLIKAWCAEARFDAIVSADGDGDRPLVADENGDILRGDFVGLITAQFLGAEVVATPVTSNSGIDAHLERGTLRTRVGSPFVIAAMDEALARGDNRIVGFEANGGFFTAMDFVVNGAVLKALPTRDCFLPILAVLAYAKRRPLSALAVELKLPIALSGRLENFALERSQRLMAKLNASPQALADFLAPLGRIAKQDESDGLRVTLASGAIVHLRPSGNAPEFRCYVEAENEAAAETLLSRALVLLETV